MKLSHLSSALALSGIATAAVVVAVPSVNCKDPWVKIATALLDAVFPSSEAAMTCSSILGKYRTTTKTVTATTGTVVTTKHVLLASTAPSPTTTTSIAITNTLDITGSTTIPYTATSTTTELVIATSFDYESTVITVTAQPAPTYTGGGNGQKRDVYERDGRSSSEMVAKMARLAGIASSLVSGFCSCRAPGPTSTSTAVATAFANATSTSTVTSYTKTVTPAAVTVTITSYNTVTSVVEVDTVVSTTVEIDTATTTATEVDTVVATATVTAAASFYLRIDAPGNPADGQCAFWEPGEANTLSFAGSSEPSLLMKPPLMWSIDPATSYLSANGLVAGSGLPTCAYDGRGDCSRDFVFIRGYTGDMFTGSRPNSIPATCQWAGLDGGTVNCTYAINVTSRGQPTQYQFMYDGLQQQYWPADGSNINGQQVLMLQSHDYDLGISMQGFYSQTSCAGYGG